jgi:A/G-specific adenine glycosylase
LHPITSKLVRWYRANRIPYPWRLTADPYRIWLSEILLQQTRIRVALRYYEAILQHFPTLPDLAGSDASEFLALWSGIGYYQRARNMVACARLLVREHGGQFPSELDQLLQLPGIGRYTAGALRNLCFGKLTPALDGNVTRVIARLTGNSHRVESPIFRKKLETDYLEIGAKAVPSEFQQALMELGERICTPRPNCDLCPVHSFCEAKRKGIIAEIPQGRARKTPENYYWYLLALRKNGRYFFVRNPNRKFLKDAWLFPDVLTRSKIHHRRLVDRFARRWNIDISSFKLAGQIPHNVTYRKITVKVLASSEFELTRPDGGRWYSQKDLRRYPTSSLMPKVLSLCSSDQKS